jgi:hypothetical protein
VVPIPVELKDFFSFSKNLENSGANSCSPRTGSGGPSPGVKQPEREADHSPPCNTVIKTCLQRDSYKCRSCRSRLTNLGCRHVIISDRKILKRAFFGGSLQWMNVCSRLRQNRSAGSEVDPIKADSHITCRVHAVPLPCRALIHTYHAVPLPCRALIHTRHAVPLPCSDSAVSFVKVRMVAGNIRTASPTV